MSVLSRGWLWPRKTTADWLWEENRLLSWDMQIARVLAGRRPSRVAPRWMGR